MKAKLYVIIGVLVLIAIILFCPTLKTKTISGSAEVLTEQKEKTGTCSLDLEIRELSSLLVCYQRTFSFSINGTSSPELSYLNYRETSDGLCSITQAFLDEAMNAVDFCSLTYHNDYSFAVLHYNNTLYFLPNGTDMTYADIPVNILG